MNDNTDTLIAPTADAAVATAPTAPAVTPRKAPSKTKKAKAKAKAKATVKKGDGRGRKPMDVKMPRTAKFTINDVIAANPVGTDGKTICRITANNAVKGWLKAKTVLRTKETKATGTVGKPATIYAKAGKANLATAPAVSVA